MVSLEGVTHSDLSLQKKLKALAFWQLARMEVKLLPTPFMLGIIVLLVSVASSASTLIISNLNGTNVMTTSFTFTWDVFNNGTDNGTDVVLLRSYITLQNNLNIEVDSDCLQIDTTRKEFTRVEPFSLYSACVQIVQLDNDDEECDEENHQVLTNDMCTSVTTEFAPWSFRNIAAVGCASAILIIVVIALIINIACPVKKVNESVDKQKMREWSKKKRVESVRDFVDAVNAKESYNDNV